MAQQISFTIDDDNLEFAEKVMAPECEDRTRSSMINRLVSLGIESLKESKPEYQDL